MINKFYRFRSDDKRSAVEIETKVPFKTGSYIPLDSEMVINNIFVIGAGKKFFDIAGFVDSFEHFAISKRFKDLLEMNKVKGWACFPIIIKGTSEEYFVFRPTFEAGPILNLEKVNRYEEPLKFDISTWDGSGIFTLKNTTTIICTEEVKKLIENAKITNISFREL
jgi:hypothetical protein